MLNKDPRFYWCYRCSACYHEKKRVCWFPITGRSPVLASTGIGATAFKQEFGGTVRNLPGADAHTIIPVNPDLQPDTNSGWLKLPSFKIKIPGSKRLFGGCISLAIIAFAYVAYQKYYATEDKKDGDEEDEQERNPGVHVDGGLHEVA